MDGVAVGRVEEGEGGVGTEGDAEVVLSEDTLELDKADVLQVLQGQPVVHAHGHGLIPVPVLARVDDDHEWEAGGVGGAEVLEGEWPGEGRHGNKTRRSGSGRCCSGLCEVGGLDTVAAGYHSPVETVASGNHARWRVCGLILKMFDDDSVRTTKGFNRTKGRRAEGVNRTKGRSAEGVNRTKIRRAEGVNRTKGKSAEGVNWTKGRSAEGVNRTKGRSAEGVNRTKGRSAEGVNRTKGRSAEGVNRTKGRSAEGVNRTKGRSAEGVNRTKGRSAEGVNRTKGRRFSLATQKNLLLQHAV